MAVLIAAELDKLRQGAEAEKTDAITYVKADANAAFQALEDWYEGERTAVSGLIDTATSPFVFTNTEKKKMAGVFLKQKFVKELA